MVSAKIIPHPRGGIQRDRRAPAIGISAEMAEAVKLEQQGDIGGNGCAFERGMIGFQPLKRG